MAIMANIAPIVPKVMVSVLLDGDTFCLMVGG